MTEQETIERLKKDYAPVLKLLEGQTLHYMTFEGEDLGFVLREPTLKEIIEANIKMTSLSGGSLTEAGRFIFNNCLIGGAIDQEIKDNNRLLVSAYNISRKILDEDYVSKKN